MFEFSSFSLYFFRSSVFAIVISSGVIFSFCGLLLSVCALSITVIIHLIKFTALISGMQSALASINLSIAEMKADHKEDIYEIKKWREKINEIILRPSWKRTIPPQK